MKKPTLLDKLAGIYIISLFTPPLWLFITSHKTDNPLYGILGLICTGLAFKLLINLSDPEMMKPDK